MRIRITALLQVMAQNLKFDVAVVVTLAPFINVAVAKAVGARLVCEQRDDAILRFTFGTGLFSLLGSFVKQDASAEI